MGGANGVAGGGGSCPLCPMPCPHRLPPVVVKKNIYVPSRSILCIVAA